MPARSGNRTDRALDWAHAEVREHYYELIREALEIFDLDGLELDWMRFGYFFGIGRELEGGNILTQFVAEVRRAMAKAAKKWRHPVELGVRVPSTPETARQLGLDGAAWARAGLIDLFANRTEACRKRSRSAARTRSAKGPGAFAADGAGERDALPTAGERGCGGFRLPGARSGLG